MRGAQHRLRPDRIVTAPSTTQPIEVTANGYTFAALTAAPADGPLALCLHGFPDSPHPALPSTGPCRDGVRAVAPRMRGYAPTTATAWKHCPRTHARHEALDSVMRHPEGLQTAGGLTW
jgi:pimeloyl-ACP methyl ester carboxylesterase